MKMSIPAILILGNNMTYETLSNIYNGKNSRHLYNKCYNYVTVLKEVLKPVPDLKKV